MASERTLALAKKFLNAHAVSAEEFGLGPYLEKGAGQLEILYSREPQNLKSLMLKFSDSGPTQCRTIAEKLYADIKHNHPELKPRIIFGYLTNGFQNWVEITCPKTKKKIQIDCTPWYSSGLNPGHKAGEDTTDWKGGFTAISNRGGIPFAMKKFGDEIATILLEGYSPKLAGEGVNSPEYTFILALTLQNKPSSWADGLLVDVMDCTTMQELFRRGNVSIKNLAESGAVKFSIALLDEQVPVVKKDLPRIKSIISERMPKNKEFAGFLAENLPRMVLLLKKATATLPFCEYPKEKIDVTKARSILELAISWDKFMKNDFEKRMKEPPPSRSGVLLGFQKRFNLT